MGCILYADVEIPYCQTNSLIRAKLALRYVGGTRYCINEVFAQRRHAKPWSRAEQSRGFFDATTPPLLSSDVPACIVFGMCAETCP